MSELLTRWEKTRRAIGHYLYAMFAQSFNAATAALYAFLGAANGAAFDPEHFDAPGWRTLAWTFITPFCLGVVFYLNKHPIPDKLPETTPPFASTTEIKDGQITTTADDPKTLTHKP